MAKKPLFTQEQIASAWSKAQEHDAHPERWTQEEIAAEAYYSFRRFSEAGNNLAGCALDLTDDFLDSMGDVIRDCAPEGKIHRGGYAFTAEMAAKVTQAAQLVSNALTLMIEVGAQTHYLDEGDLKHWEGCKESLDKNLQEINYRPA